MFIQGGPKIWHNYYVQCILLAAGRHTQVSDATDQWRYQWRRRLECVVQQQGGHIEHLM